MGAAGLLPRGRNWVMDHDPLLDVSDILEKIPVYESAEGRVLSNVKFNSSTFPTVINDTIDGECLPYHVAYLRDGDILFNDCLKIHPNWMSERASVLEEVHLTSVILPGVHDAGAGTPYKEWAPDGFVEDVVAKWTFTQDTDMWTQLVCGVRYFDMRLSYYPNGEYSFYVNHGDVRIAPLEPYLMALENFLESTEEIVIFDIHSLEHNFDDYLEAKLGLNELISSYVGRFMLSAFYAPNPTLKTIWNSGKRLIVTYPSGSKPSNYYWDSVAHVYPNTNDLEYLLDFFNTNIPLNANRSTMWSCMSEFTETALDVAMNT